MQVFGRNIDLATRRFIGNVHRNAALVLAVTLVATALVTGPPASAAPATDFVLDTYATGLDLPTDLDWAPNGLLFVAEKGGLIKVVDAGVVSTFVDISVEVNSNTERGLLGIAVHPDFATGSPFVYALYTYDPPESADETGNAGRDGGGQRVSRLTRFTADSATGFKTAVGGSATTILGGAGNWTTAGDPSALEVDASASWACGSTTFVDDCIPADARNHPIGGVIFGADRMLYVGNGDASGFSAEIRSLRALDPDSLAGKIMRLDPSTGEGLSDNPLWDGDPNSNRSRVWYLGLRNPFRFTQSPAGALWVGDVGAGAWEEVDTGPAGSDFGWPCYEGGAAGVLAQNVDFVPFSECQSYYAANNAVAPTYSYSHAAGGAAAIIAGEFYTGTDWPVEYHGALVIADYVRSTMTAVQVEADPITETGLATDVLAVSASFGPDGHLYLAGIAGGSVDRIRYAPGEVVPGSLRTTTFPAVPSTISLDGIERSQWGLDWITLAPGTRQQCFSDVPGFVTPGCRQVGIATGVTAVTQGNFLRKAALQARTRVSGTIGDPVESVISVDGIPFSKWGLVADLAPGTVEICWGAVADFAPPPCQIVALTAGGQTAVEGVFVPDPGAPGPTGPSGPLRVTTSPAVPSTISVDGTDMKQFGLEWVPTAPGLHEICFSDVPGFITPACQDVVVSDGVTTVVAGNFVALGTLQATTSPASNVTISVDGIPRNQWGLFTNIQTGTHTVCAGFVSGEQCDVADIVSGATTTLVLSAQASNAAPVADAGPDQSVVDIDGTGAENVSLDGLVSFDPDGTVVLWDWRESGVLIAAGATPTVSLSVGSHSIELTVIDNEGATATDVVTVNVDPAPTPDVLYVSSATDGSVGGVDFDETDILSFNTGTGVWAMFFDGSDVGIPGSGGRDVDAVHLLDDGTILVSVLRGGSLAGVGDMEDADILRFVPTSLGSNTAGTFEMYFDGSDVGLSDQAENVDAVHVLTDGDLVLSTRGTADVPGVAAITEHDLIRFAPTSLGTVTAGSWSVYLDGSDVDLTNEDEQVDGAWVDPAGDIFLTTLGSFSVTAASGIGADIFACANPTVGPSSSCTFGVFWDASTNGFASGETDALFVARS